jgi:hypothetical protein
VPSHYTKLTSLPGKAYYNIPSPILLLLLRYPG